MRPYAGFGHGLAIAALTRARGSPGCRGWSYTKPSRRKPESLGPPPTRMMLAAPGLVKAMVAGWKLAAICGTIRVGWKTFSDVRTGGRSRAGYIGRLVKVTFPGRREACLPR